MTAGAAGGPKLRDIIGALRKAAGAIVSVAGIVDRVNDVVGTATNGAGAPDFTIREMQVAAQELQEAVNQLATDELEDDMRAEALARDLGLLGAEMRGLRELPRQMVELRNEFANVVNQLRAQNDELRAQRDNLIRAADGNAELARRVLELEATRAGAP